MSSGTARRGETVPGRMASVVGLWQRLNFWPLPHQHGWLAFGTENVASVTDEQRRRRQTDRITRTRPSARPRRRRRLPRVRIAGRLISQLVVLSVGGAIAGGLLLLAVIPTDLTISWVPLAGGAALTLWLTIRSAARMQPRR